MQPNGSSVVVVVGGGGGGGVVVVDNHKGCTLKIVFKYAQTTLRYSDF
jgi:hypothetical protein